MASGTKLFGVLLSNGRAVGVVRSNAHKTWVMNNLMAWVKQKRLVSVTALPKPQVTYQYSVFDLINVFQ